MQISLDDWPPDLCREIATFEPDSIVKHLGLRLRFDRGFDDLDGFLAAAFIVENTPFVLQKYDRIPTGQYTLLTTGDPLAAGQETDQARVRQFLVWSGLPDESVTWRRP